MCKRLSLVLLLVALSFYGACNGNGDRPADQIPADIDQQVAAQFGECAGRGLAAFFPLGEFLIDLFLYFDDELSEPPTGYNPIKDLYKTRVFETCRWRNAHHRPWMKASEGAVIPVRVIDKGRWNYPDARFRHCPASRHHTNDATALRTTNRASHFPDCF